MTEDEVVARLKKLLIERVRISPDRVQGLEPDSPLLKDGLGMDSLDCIELIMGIEEEFSLFIEESEEEDWMHHFSCLRTISQIVLSSKGELT